MKPGDFAKYASEKQANPLASLGKSFLSGVGRMGAKPGGRLAASLAKNPARAVARGSKRLSAFGGRMARGAGEAAGWATKNPGTAGALGLGGLFVANRLGGQSQPQYQMRY